MSEKDYVAFYTGGPRDGLIEHIADAVVEILIADDSKMQIAEITTLTTEHTAAMLRTGRYERGKTTRDTAQMNVALYHWRGWSNG